MNDRSGDGTGSFEVKIRTKTVKFTNMIVARFRESRYLVRESEVFIKNKTKKVRCSSKIKSDVLQTITDQTVTGKVLTMLVFYALGFEVVRFFQLFR